MQLPKRRSQQQPRDTQDVIYLTQDGVDRLHRELANIERQKPQAIDDVSRSIQLGDLSENAEYQEAKHRLSRMHSRVFYINDRLRRVKVIQHDDTSDEVTLGSTVTLMMNDQKRLYQIVGPSEANPTHGRISNVSPLGSELMHKHVGDSITIQTPNGAITYHIIAIG